MSEGASYKNNKTIIIRAPFLVMKSIAAL